MLRTTEGKIGSRRSRLTVAVAAIASTALIATTATALSPEAAAATGDPITGSIWQDYDANGVFDSFETGVAGVEVYAYDSDGNQAGPASTDASGSYSLPVTSGAGRWRVEARVPDAPQWSQWRDGAAGPSGAGNGTTVQIAEVVDGVGASGVDFAFQVPSAYVENNPRVYIPVLHFGGSDGANANQPGSGVIFWDAQTSGSTPVPQTGVVPFSQVGATNGTAMTRAEDLGDVPTVFTSAYLRRHSGFGPGGIGGIYRVTPDGADWGAATASGELYVDLVAAGIDLGGPSRTAPATEHGLRPDVASQNPAYNWIRDAQAWNHVGRAGLGLMSLSPDERYLFVVNLHNRSLIRIDTGGDPAAAPAAIEEFELDSHFPDDSDIRPYGVSVDPLTGTMYLTATNTAETSQQVSDLHGYVYSFDAESPGTLSQVLSFPLDFPRSGFSPTFYPWATNSSHYPTGTSLIRYNQPVVASVQILHGDLIIGVRDLVGDQFGNATFLSGDPTDGDTRVVNHVRSEGDVFIAEGSADGTFTLESNGVHRGVFGDGAMQGDLGPGGLRYFDTGYTPFNQDNESTGSIVVMPSRPDGIMTTGVHVANGALQEGTRRLFQGTGAAWDPTGALIRSTAGTGVTTKGNGLGSASVLASAAPIEIGNYVWHDADNDGVQDPDEAPVVGATVNLYEVAADGTRTLVSSTTTNEHGEYSFSSDPALSPDGYVLRTHTDYVIGLDNPADYEPGGPLHNRYPTVPHTGDSSSVDPTLNDSDGIVEQTPEGSFPFAAVTTGGPGQNDHSIDFGFAPIDYEFDKRAVSGPTESPDGDGTWVIEYELVVENTGAVDGDYDLTDDLTGYGSGIEIVETAVVSGPTGALLNSAWNGVGDQRVVTAAVPIPAGSTTEAGTAHLYLIRVTVALQTEPETGEAFVEPEQLVCLPAEPTDGQTTGLFNTATLVPSNHEDLVDTECGELPLVTLTKSVVTEPYVVDRTGLPGVWEITYGLTVTNETAAATDYDLVDELRFGTGVEIVPGSVVVASTSPAGIETNASYDGLTDTTIVRDEPIAGSTSHSHEVTVRFTVDLPEPSGAPDPSDCTLAPGAEGERGTGLYNAAASSFNGYPDSDDECRPVAQAVHDKTVISAEPIGEGLWEVVYGIEVRNRGEAPTLYDLDDELRFAEEIEVIEAAVTDEPAGVTPAEPAWDGLENPRIVEGAPLAGTGAPDYEPHAYELTVIASVPLQLEVGEEFDPALCPAPGAALDALTAFNNVSQLTDEAGVEQRDQACAAVPGFVITKEAAGEPVANGDGTFTVGYDVVVTNTGGAAGTYEVTDRLRFGAGLRVAAVGVVSAPAGVTLAEGWTGQGEPGDEENVVAGDVVLAAGEVHAYRIEVIVEIDADTFTQESLTCPEPGSQEIGGLANTAGLAHNDLTDSDEACVTLRPGVELEKTIAAGPVTQDDGRYTITYEIEVTNTGGIPTGYVLSDQLRFGAGLEVTGVEVENAAPGQVPVLDSFTGLGEEGSTENRITGDVELGIDQVHVYTVAVAGQLDADTATRSSVECSPDGAAGESSGLLNVASVDHDGDVLTDDACAALIPPPGVDLPRTGAGELVIAAAIAALLVLLGGAALAIRGARRRPEPHQATR